MDPTARDLLDRSRSAHDPVPADRARVRAKLAAKIAAGTVLGGSVAKAGVSISSPVLKLVIGVAFAGALGAYVVLRALAPAPTQAPLPPAIVETHAPAPTLAPSASPTVGETAEPTASVEPAPIASTAPVVVVARPKSLPAPDLEAETSMLAEAQSAIQRGDFTSAIAKLDAYDKSYPSGVLTEERTAARVVALCGAGRATEARAAGKAFLARWPRSPLAPRVKDSCAAP